MRNWLILLASVVVTIPALVIRVMELTGSHIGLTPLAMAAIFGLAIIGGAYLISVGAEIASTEMSQGLALAMVALIAVLPEYAVDFVFTWKAGAEQAAGIPLEEQRWVHLAVANMTGANRLLVGIGWPLIILLYYFRRRQSVRLERGISLDLLVLGLATVWAFTVLFTDAISLWHSAVFIGLFAVYVWMSSKGAASHEEDLVGPAMTVARLPTVQQRIVNIGMFVFAAIVILAAAEPFAENLVNAGESLGVDEFLLAQWIAPLASELPEIAIAVLFTLRGNVLAALTALISSKVNQWTLLVGTLPVVYSTSLGEPAALPMDARQQQEVLLTAAQSLFAVVLLVKLRIGAKGALLLVFLFALQLLSPLYPSAAIPLVPDPEDRNLYSIIYLVLTALLFVVDRERIAATARIGRFTLERIRGQSPPAESESGH